jgi:hypothetical protein
LGRRRSRPEIKRVCQGVFVLVLWTCAEIFSSIYFLFDDVIVTHSIQSYSGIFRENLTSGLKRFGYFRISKSILAYFTFFSVSYKYKSFSCHKLDYFLRTIFVQKVCHTILWPITQKGLKVIFNTTQSHMCILRFHPCMYIKYINVHNCTVLLSWPRILIYRQCTYVCRFMELISFFGHKDLDKSPLWGQLYFW